MSDPLSAALNVAASALEAQSLRMRVVSENLANAQSTGKTPEDDPYRRKTVTFAEEYDRVAEANLVKIDRIGRDMSAFVADYRPGHPAADERGYVKMPNVNIILELADLREANRSYEANLQIVRQTREMLALTIDLLKQQG
jgi:flagellar basal-body rod protein FlgC